MTSSAGRQQPLSADIAKVLRQSILLGPVPDDDIAALMAISKVRTVRKGQIVCVTGDPGDTLIAVITGRLKVIARSADGGELTLTSVGPAGMIGDVSVADSGPRSADAEAAENSVLMFIPRQAAQDICARIPAAAQALASSIATSLRRLTEATSDLVFLDLPRRVAKILISQPRDESGKLRPHLTQGELAQQAGGTRQSVNAALRAFERRGWIQAASRSLTVAEPESLARFAGEQLEAL